MRKSYLLIASSLLAFACAAQPPSDAPAAAPPAPEMRQMQGRMDEMHALMERIRNTEDPAERRRLMTEHMRVMQEGMAMMGGMMRGPDAGPAAQRQCADNDATCRMQGQQGMMGQRMGMMQMMMEQMMAHMMQQAAVVEPDETPREPAPATGSEQNHEAHH